MKGFTCAPGILAILVFVSSASSESCKDDQLFCIIWKDKGKLDCETIASFKLICKKSCNLCEPGDPTPDQTSCEDQFAECLKYKNDGTLDCTSSSIRTVCKKSCNNCNFIKTTPEPALEPEPTICKDDDPECIVQKDIGKLDCKIDWVRSVCKKSCNLCDHGVPPPELTRTTLQPLAAPTTAHPKARTTPQQPSTASSNAHPKATPVCRDSGGRWCTQNKELDLLRCDVDFIRKRCKKSCGICKDKGETECKDYSYLCRHQSLAGACNKEEMRQKCQKSCDICGTGFGEKLRRLCKDLSLECSPDYCFGHLDAIERCPKTCGDCLHIE